MVSKVIMKDAWKQVYLHEVCNINPTYKIPDGETSSFIDMASVAEDSPKPRNIEIREYKKTSASKFKNGDVVFARITPCTENGKTALVQGLATEHGFGSTEFIVLSPKEELDSKFLYYMVKDGKVRNKAIARMVGTTGRQRVPNEFFRDELEISLPPLTEQRKIAAILTSVDDAIDATQRIIDQTEVVKRGLMQQLLTRGIGHTTFKETEIGEIPTEWDVVKLGEVADFINGRGFKPHEWSTIGLPIIRIQNLNGSTEFNYYEGDFNEKILTEPGTLLFAWSGSRGTSFGPHIWAGPKGVLNYHTWKVEHADSVVRQYLYYSLAKITTQIENDSHGASALVHMQKAYVVDYRIPLPPFEEQKEISDILGVYDKKLENEKHALFKLEVLKKGLMQVLLSGRVRVNVDEPSEVSV